MVLRHGSRARRRLRQWNGSSWCKLLTSAVIQSLPILSYLLGFAAAYGRTLVISEWLLSPCIFVWQAFRPEKSEVELG